MSDIQPSLVTEDGAVGVRCHLCGKWKDAPSAWRALYELAFHYDRRHRGWTQPGVLAVRP